MNDNQQLAQQISTFISDDLLLIAPDEFSSDTNLFSLGLDSLKIMRLVHFLEQTFFISIPDEELVADRIRDVNAIVTLVATHVSN